MKDNKLVIVITALALAVTGVGAASQELVTVNLGDAVTLNHYCALSQGGYISMGREEMGGVHCTYKWTTDSNPPVQENCKAPDNILVAKETLKNGTGILTLKFAGGAKHGNQGQYRAHCSADPFPKHSIWMVTVIEGPVTAKTSTGAKLAVCGAVFCLLFCVGAAINMYTIWVKKQSVAEERESGGDLDLEANEMEVTLE